MSSSNNTLATDYSDDKFDSISNGKITDKSDEDVLAIQSDDSFGLSNDSIGKKEEPENKELASLGLDDTTSSTNNDNLKKVKAEKLPPLTESIKRIPHHIKKWCKKTWKKIPKEYFSWKRWLAFFLSCGIAFIIFAFIPTNSDKLISVDNPNPEINWYSMVPPTIAIAFAVCFKQVLMALSLGIFIGGMIHFKGNVYHVFVYLIFHNIWDAFQAYVVGFTLTLVGMVYVMHKSGGLDGLCNLVIRLARSTYSTRIVTAFSGIVFFFDDYGNTVVVGSTFKGLASNMQISSEKLAYIVDSTAAPVAGVAIISTWIGTELSYFEDVAENVGIDMSGYDMFLNALPYRFYCYAALFIVFINQIMARDFGPMLAAEKRALIEGKIHADDAKIGKDLTGENAPDPNLPKRWYYAGVPLLVVLLGSLFGMFWNGRQAVYDAGESLDIFNDAAWRLAIGSSDSAYVLFYSAIAGTVVAILMPIYGETITVDQATRSFLSTIPSMYEAIILLYLAWGIKSTCSYMGTSNYLVAILGDIPLSILPLVTFLMAALTALAIGSSWSTMGILLPIMQSLAYTLGEQDPNNTSTGLTSHSELIFYLTGAAVLDGAILGDHCSPISDTTVLSSVATSCDLMAHVKTQMPYALTGGFIAAILGYLSVSFGMPFWLFYPLSIVLGCIIFYIFGAPLPKANDIEINPGMKAKDLEVRSPFMSLVHKLTNGRLG